MEILGVDHALLAAPPGCEDEARRYFGELLGLVEVEKPEALRDRGGVWFRLGAQQLHIGIDRDFAPAHKAHPAFAVDDLDVLADRLVAAGFPVERDDALVDPRRFYSADPWGNRLELVESDRAA